MPDRMTRFVAREYGAEFIIEDLESGKHNNAQIVARTRHALRDGNVLTFLAAAGNAFYDAGKMQQYDPLILAESLDLSGLICAAEEARRVLEGDTSTVAGIKNHDELTKQVLLHLQDALRTLPPRPKRHINELVQTRAQEH